MAKRTGAARQTTAAAAVAAPAEPRARVTTERAGRLYRLLVLLGRQAISRQQIVTQLNVGLRTFYRDVDLLRSYGVEVAASSKGYTLHMPLDRALHALPCPDPELTFGEVLSLMKGKTRSHQRLKEVFERVTDG